MNHKGDILHCEMPTVRLSHIRIFRDEEDEDIYKVFKELKLLREIS